MADCCSFINQQQSLQGNVSHGKTQLIYLNCTHYIVPHDDTIKVSIVRNLTDRQHNEQEKKKKMTKVHPQNATHKTIDRTTRTPLVTGDDRRCSVKVRSDNVSPIMFFRNTPHPEMLRKAEDTKVVIRRVNQGAVRGGQYVQEE